MKLTGDSVVVSGDLHIHVQTVYKKEMYLLFRVLPYILLASPTKRETRSKSLMSNTREMVYKALNIQVYTPN